MAKDIKYDYIDERNKPFVNPYNFVPVDFRKKGERVDVTQKRDALLTGYLDCRLKCRTPLAIPDTQNRKEDPAVKKGHYKYPFYMAGGTVPVIPGSAIRGVVRSVYETLTDSCYGTMQKNTMITIRSGKPFAPGLLIKEDNGWNLYSAKRWLLVTDRRFYGKRELDREGIECYDSSKQPLKALRTGESVLFHPARNAQGEIIPCIKTNRKTNRGTLIGPYIKKIEEKDADGTITGYFCRGEIAPRRHFQSVFEKRGLVRREIGEIDFARLENILNIYRDKSINRKYKDGSEEPHNGYPEYETAKKQGVIPVYYDNTARPETQNGKLYMSFAALGRKAFQRTMNENVQLRAHQECIQRRSLCPACALFGTAEGEKLGSGVRFSDALCTNCSEDSIKENVVFEELSSPRISFLPFYMKACRDKKTGKGKEADYRAGYDSDDLEIRGRKYYWHHVPAAPGAIELTERNATFDVLREGAEFSFRIYFDRITPGQLATIEEAVHLNENMLDGDLCHKIGHGKPLGYGSVKIAIENCVLRSFDAEHGWSETTAEIPCPQIAHTCDDLTYRSLMTICNFRAIENFGNAKVEYPSIIPGEGCPVLHGKADNDLAAHKWFSENFKLNQPTAVSLPEILEEKGQLCKKKAVKPGGESVRTGSSRSAEKPADMPEKIYAAKILSSGRPARNLKYMEYDIEIEEDAYLSGRKCTMTAHKSIQLSAGQKVKVIQYRGTLFNFKGL